LLMMIDGNNQQEPTLLISILLSLSF